MSAISLLSGSIGLAWAVSLLLPMGALRAEGLSDWQARKAPRLRIAASPYPNLLLHVLPTDADFGVHFYRVRCDTLGMGPSSERSRGHFYTRRGGFLDLAHIRRAIDFAGYVHYRVREGLQQGGSHFSFESIDQTTYHVRFAYPAYWAGLSPAARERLIEEIAVQAGASAAIELSNWREIITWYGFHNVPGMPEKGSAFSYEDLPSHAVGAAVAMRALRAPGVPFNEAVERELDRELGELGIVPRELYYRAMGLVENRWWGKKTCLKRHLDNGLDDGFVTPWLVRGLEPGSAPVAKSYPGPRKYRANIGGHEIRGIVVFECEPRLGSRKTLHAILPPGTSRVSTARDYPAILARIREEVSREFGPDAMVPYP